MFRTKKDVDRHSQEVLNKVRTEKERNLRCLNIAQQYYNVCDYDSAKKYVSMYLSVKDDSSAAHKLLGQCHEQFGEKAKALQEYLYSLQIDPKQPELILKVCELFVDDDCVVDKSQAKQWFEVAEKQYPYHPTVLKLRKKLFLMDDSNYSSLENTLIAEFKSKPCDPAVHTQLLTFYIDNSRVKEAYDEAFSKPLHFTPTIQWYQCAVKICKSYKSHFPSALKEEFYANNLLSLERLLALAVQDVKLSRKSIPECISFLARLDDTLSEAVKLVNKSVKFQHIISHMCGQLCFHTASILYRKLRWEDNNSQEMNHLISPLLLLSTSKNFKITEDRGLNDGLTRVYNNCLLHNAYRISQCGFVLHGLAKESAKQFIEKIFHLCVGNQWKERISEKVFSTSDYKSFRKESFFMTYSAFSNLPSELPSLVAENVEKTINIVESLNAVSLHHLIWLGVNYLSISDNNSLCDMFLSHQFFSRKFNSLPFHSQWTASSYAESLCRLDVDAFLYASVFSAKSYVDQQIANEKYQIIPADVSKPMSSPDQEQWWECVYQMCSKTTPENNIPKSRSTLQRGIEAVRLTGVGAMPLPLLVLLGRTFAKRAAVEPDGDKASALEERAALYWKTALPLLEKLARNEMTSGPIKSMFEYHKNVITKAEAIKLVDEGKRIVGMLLIKENDYSDSICDQVNESYGDFNASMSSTSVTNVLGDRIVQNLIEQNTKIMDRLETLFNKQELLCSNQFQLLEMISTLTKKLENMCLPDYPTTSQSTQSSLYGGYGGASLPNTMTPAAVPNMLNQPITPKVQTNFPMYPFVHSQMNANVNGSFQTPTRFHTLDLNTPAVGGMYPIPPVGQPQTPAGVWNAGGNFPLNGNQRMLSELLAAPPKLEPGAPFMSAGTTPQSSVSSFATAYPAISQALENASFTETSKPAPNVAPVTAFSSRPAVTLSDCIQPPKFTPVKTTASAVVTPSTGVFGSPNTSFASPKTTTPNTHAYQIPVPEASVVVKSPPIEIPEDEDDTQPIEYDPIPDFKPIVPLPDEVVVKTGEENEQVLYENRVKLFRFVDKEWKERGVGVYKLLKNAQTGKVRALMRRETVHKVCANHMLSEEIELKPMNTNDKAWLYSAPDYADERLQWEQFCIKFKTVEEAKQFYDIFNKCKAGTPKTPQKDVATGKPPVETKSPVEDAGKTAKKNIIAPPQMKIANETETKTESPKSNAFSFGSASVPSVPVKPTPNAFTFGAKTTETPKTETKSAFAGFTGFSLNTLQPNSMSNLFQTKSVTAGDSMPKNSNDAAPFASVTNAIDFSSLSKSSTGFTKSKDFKGFDGAGSKVFGSQSTTPKSNTVASPVAAILKNVVKKDDVNEKADTSCDATLNDSTSVANEEEFVPTQEFSPVIPLPDLIEVKTGEEGLDVLYEDRCKLFRYTGNEWKERGVGNMKILRDPKDGSVRLLMRREQVYKLCCNQRVTKEQELKPHSTSDKAWTWCGKDFSEGKLEDETFCVKFKTVEQALKFKDAFNNAKSKIETPKKDATAPKASEDQQTLPKLSDMFKKESGSWECKMCYVVNKKDTDVCVSCSSPRNPSEQKPSTCSTGSVFGSASTDSGTFSFGSLAASVKLEPSKFTFGMPAASSVTTQSTNSTSGAAKESSTTDLKSDGFKFKFGSSDNSAPVCSSVSAVSTTFTFGSGSVIGTANPNLFNFGRGQAKASAPVKDGKFSFAPPVTSNESSSTFTPIGSQNSAMSAFKFGSTTPVASSGPMFNVNETPDSTKNENDGSFMSRFSFGTSKSQENASIFGSTKSDSTPLSFGFGKSDENSSIFGSGVSGNTSVFGTPLSSKSEVNTGAYDSFTFRSNKIGSPTSSHESKSSQESTPFQERFPILVNDNEETRCFKSFAKLYCKIDAKEEYLGRGNLYLLKNPNTSKSRLLMRREPAELVCLNHFVTTDMNFEKFDDYSWVWKAFDFSEGEVSERVFRVVFSDIETAEKFKNSVDDVMKDVKENSADSPASSEVEFVSETKVTEDEIRFAESLQLPPNFFSYKYNAKDCPGCVGCDDDDRKLKAENKENQPAKTIQPLPSLFGNTVAKSSSILGSDSIKPSFVFGDTTSGGSWLDQGTFKLGSIFGTPNSQVQNSPSQKPASGEEAGSDGDDSVVKNDQDPYFEPVVPLPDIVEVRTGEEDEEIKFCERGKLFRYSQESKEWKERGVGEMKILYHPVDKSYRLLMRREQVHKVVLNQRITTTLNLQALSANKNSWCWFGANLTEENGEPEFEKLAVRFKTDAIANKFFEIVRECLFDLESRQFQSKKTQGETNEAQSEVREPEGEINKSRDEVKEPESEVHEYDDRKTTSDVDDDRDYDDGDYNEYDRGYGGDAEYEDHDYYVDEDAIGEAMEELDTEEGQDVVYQKEVHIKLLEGESSAEYDGVISLLRKYDEEGSGCIVFSTQEVSDMYTTDITDGMNMVNEGDGNVVFLELNENEYERKMLLQFENDDDAEKFTSTFRNLIVPTM